VAICRLCNFGVISKTAKLKVEKSALTTSRFSSVSYRNPQLIYTEKSCLGINALAYQSIIGGEKKFYDFFTWTGILRTFQASLKKYEILVNFSFWTDFLNLLNLYLSFLSKDI
jgi:hypothetical protein